MNIRIGSGIDFHRLVVDRAFWLGGIEIPHHKGALGHSDADVLLHAISDALLGALSLNDIGHHFPDTDNSIKGIDSKIILKKCYSLVKEKGFSVVNLDTTLCLQAPKIKPFVPQMQEVIAEILEIPIDCISIKATTTEKLSFIGREEGVCAMATVLLINM